MDVIEYLREALHERVARKGEEFKVSWVSGVRDYNAWLNPLQVKLYNAFSNSIEILQHTVSVSGVVEL